MVLATILCFSFVTASAWAGSKQRYRWEGVAIGLGAAIVGNALLNDYYYDRPSRTVVYHNPPPVVYYSPPPVVRYWSPPAHRYGHYKRWGRHHRLDRGCW